MSQCIELVNGETVTSAQLSQWRREFGGAFVDPRGCLLIRAGDACNWHVLNEHIAFNERNDAFAGEMHDGVGGYLPRRTSVVEFIAAARRLKAWREECDARDARERESIATAFAERRWLERACSGAVGSDTH